MYHTLLVFVTISLAHHNSFSYNSPMFWPMEWSGVVKGDHYSEIATTSVKSMTSVTVAFSRQFYHNLC